MSYQGKELTTDMKEFVVNQKLHFNEEKKVGKFVSTRNVTKRVSDALGIDEAIVKRIMAAHNKQGKEQEHTLEIKERGKPPYRLSINLQPVIREFIRQKNLKGEKIRVEQIREYLLEKHSVDIPMSTFLRSLDRLGFTYGICK
ncbi:MAG: hypothetical protein ACMUJM_17410 [bacterium]